MNDYLDILQEKAKKINASIEHCTYDKECITNAIAAKVRKNLEHENISIIKEKAIIIEAIIPAIEDKTSLLNAIEDKTSLLNAIEERIKEILKEENERYTSMQLQESFMPIDLG